MDAREVVVAIIEALNAANIPYMLVGSLSSNAYGIERSTKDAGFVIQTGPLPLSQVFGKLPPGFSLESQIGFETITSTTRFRIQYAPLPFTIELFELSDDPHDNIRFANRVPTTFQSAPAFLPRPEDVIITKLRWSRGGKSRKKDIDDVYNVLTVQQGRLDMPYIRNWCDQHGTRQLLESTLQSIPPLPDAD